MLKNIICKEYLNQQDANEIKKLEQLCSKADGINLKLEIDYKLAVSKAHEKSIGEINDFLYYIDDTLTGYLGICSFGGSEMEVSGMVHPDFRKQGVFTELFSELTKEIEKRKPTKVLLLNDHKSVSGKNFIMKKEGKYIFSEYEMYLDLKEYMAKRIDRKLLKLRKATNLDKEEIRKQNALYMNYPLEEVDLILPEEEAKTGFIIYMAEVNGRIVGKTNLQIVDGIAGIYGLGILTEDRGKGYGRDLLLNSVEEALKMKVEKVMLQVEVENKNALGLYESAGFKNNSTMDYYKFI